VNREGWAAAVQASRTVVDIVFRTPVFGLSDSGHEGRLASGETPPTE
jgi:hypothetical protein